MALSRISEGSVAANSQALSADEGDLVLVFAYRADSAVEPSVPGLDWTTITSGSNTGSGVNGSMRCAWRLAPAGGLSSTGTWADATHLAWMVFRGSKLSGPIGQFSTSRGDNASTSITYAAVDLTAGESDQWLAAFVGRTSGHATVATAPAGMTHHTASPAGTPLIAGHSSNGVRTTDWPTTTVPLTGAKTCTIVVEVLAEPPPPNELRLPAVTITSYAQVDDSLELEEGGTHLVLPAVLLDATAGTPSPPDGVSDLFEWVFGGVGGVFGDVFAEASLPPPPPPDGVPDLFEWVFGGVGGVFGDVFDVGETAPPGGPVTAALTLPSLQLAADAANVEPVFTAAGSLTLSPVQLAAAASAADVVFLGNASLALPSVTLDGTAAYDVPDREAAAALVLPAATLAAAGTTVEPVFTAAGTLTLPAAQLAAAATVADAVFLGSATFTLPPVTVSASGVVAEPIFTATGTLLLPSVSLTSSARHSDEAVDASVDVVVGLPAGTILGLPAGVTLSYLHTWP